MTNEERQTKESLALAAKVTQLIGGCGDPVVALTALTVCTGQTLAFFRSRYSDEVAKTLTVNVQKRIEKICQEFPIIALAEAAQAAQATKH